MVILTRVLGYAKELPRKHKRISTIDRLRIRVTGGTGGSGLPLYGGLGGPGGNVYIVSQKRITLEKVKRNIRDVILKGGTGGASSKKGLIGMSGLDLNISVPIGIRVYNENYIKLGEINTANEKLMVAKGGTGGCERTGYCGLKGESRTIILDLQLLADVGLVGFPNAGKSTFLNAISRARPKIANYPFTTIRPQLGIIEYLDHRQISVVDLPGLIEGAHINKGMGYRFLKHMERTKLLLFIVDIQGYQLSFKHEHRSCLETVLLLNKEIELYNPDLLEKPAIVVINKMDTEGAEQIYDEIKAKLKNLSKHLSEFDKTIHPNKLVQFDDVIPASLISKKAQEISEIKSKIRLVIDQFEENKNVEMDDTDANEDHLRTKLKQQIQKHAPTLV